MTDGKPTEPQVLKAAMAELSGLYPMFRTFTADALCTQRSLARMILEAGKDFNFAVKDDQAELHEPVRANVRGVTERPYDAEGRRQKGARSIHGGSASWSATRSTIYDFPSIELIMRVDVDVFAAGAASPRDAIVYRQPLG